MCCNRLVLDEPPGLSPDQTSFVTAHLAHLTSTRVTRAANQTWLYLLWFLPRSASRSQRPSECSTNELFNAVEVGWTDQEQNLDPLLSPSQSVLCRCMQPLSRRAVLNKLDTQCTKFVADRKIFKWEVKFNERWSACVTFKIFLLQSKIARLKFFATTTMLINSYRSKRKTVLCHTCLLPFRPRLLRSFLLS